MYGQCYRAGPPETASAAPRGRRAQAGHANTSRGASMLPFRTNVSTTDYVQSDAHDEKHHYLRKSEGEWRILRAGLVIAQPEEGVVGSGDGDDTVFVLAGEAHVTLPDS